MDEKKTRTLLIAIFIFQATQALYWIHADNRPPSWDQAWHAMISITQYNYFTGSGILSTAQAQNVYPILAFVKNFYPPGYHTTTIPLYLIFGLNYDTAVLTNILYLLILVVSAYAIGKKIRGPQAGLMTALIASTTPVYNLLMRDYLIDFPLASLVAAGIATLIYSENFTNRRYTIFFGALTGFTTLVKWNYFLYIWAPAAVTFIFFLKNTLISGKDYAAFKPLLTSAVLAFMIAGLWYTPAQLAKTIPLVVDAAFEQGRIEGEPSGLTLKGATLYFYVILRDYSLLYFLLSVAGLALLARNYQRLSDQRAMFLLVITVLGIYVSVTLIWNKNNRYVVPIYVPLAALAGVGLSMLDGGFGRLLKILVVLLVVSQTLAFNSSMVDLRHSYGQIIFIDLKGNYPSPTPVSINELVDVMNESSGGKSFTACVIAESKFVNDITIPYYAFRNEYPVEYMIGNGCNPLNFDYSVTGPIEETWRTQQFRNAESILTRNLGRFHEVYSSGEVKVYKRIR